MDERDDRDQISGIALRYLLTDLITVRGSMRVADLVAALDREGFALRGRPAKVISDVGERGS